MAEHGVGKSLILHGFREKRDLAKEKGGLMKRIRGSFSVNSQEKREDSCPGPGTSMNKETGAGN